MTNTKTIDQRHVQSSKLLLALLGILTSIDAMSIDIYMPAMPLIQDQFGTTATRVQASLSAFFLGIVAGQLVWGPISDRFGRHRPMLIGLLFYCAGSFLAMISPDILTFISARFLQAIGASAGLVITRAMVNDLYEREAAPRIYSLLMQILGITALVSPLLGGAILLTGSWRPIFGLLLLVGIVCLIACLTALPETLPRHQRMPAGFGTFLKSCGRLMRNRIFLCAALTSGVSIAAMFVILAGGSYFFIQDHGWSGPEYSLLYAAMSLLFIFACQANIWLLGRFDSRRITRTALIAQMLLGLLLAAIFLAGSPNIWVVATFMTLVLALLGFILGNITAFAMDVTEGQAGTASGLLGVIQFILSAALLPLATAADNIGLSMSLTLAGSGVIALVLWLIAEGRKAGRSKN